MAGNVQVGLFFGDKNQVSQPLATLMAVNDVLAVIVCDADGNIFLNEIKSVPAQYRSKDHFVKTIMRSHNDSFGNQTKATRANHNNDDEQPYFEFDETVYLDVKNQEMEDLYFETMASKAGKPKLLGYVHVILSKKSFKKSVHEIVKKNVMLVLLFLGIALGVSYLLTRDVVRPLQDLILKLKINDDDNHSKDDISILDDTFSNLVDNLGQAFQTIQEFKDSLEDKVKIRTRELEHTLNELRDTQMQLVQSEKMSALGQLVAGVAHEINNTINFVSGALPPLTNRLNELKGLLAAESK
ncbi:MAG: hypothetical protein OEY01_16895, partial [Desulfobulbaceae bacterium]|nr:hypothetical protein [Desulfobulbaceae bacterium]